MNRIPLLLSSGWTSGVSAELVGVGTCWAPDLCSSERAYLSALSAQYRAEHYEDQYSLMGQSAPPKPGPGRGGGGVSGFMFQLSDAGLCRFEEFLIFFPNVSQVDY